MSLFLTDAEVAELTGIKRGSNGKTRAQMQCAHLVQIGVPFRPNVLGEPKISRDYINNVSALPPKVAANWQPAILRA